jgi:NAD(P)-dependent dehydrogenase (short-subunit alcohol dehydrogenase family)
MNIERSVGLVTGASRGIGRTLVAALRHERVIGWSAKPIGEAPVAPGEPSYAVVRQGSEEMHTSVIARLPAGGAGVVRGRIEVELAVDDLVLFAKPA